MANLDPQVQIRAIDLAWRWVENLFQGDDTAENMIKEKAKRFDQAYKAIVKTIE